MRWLVDAQLPRRLAFWLKEQGHDAIHTLDLLHQNWTKDPLICQIADEQQRIVVTKDTDFWESHLLKNTPRKLLLLKTGNMNNDRLIALLEMCLDQLQVSFETAVLIEITNEAIIVHR
ncbi:DUF5615 family PIN-like protein [Larkinella sp. VNQ87]|uniref:DUF5615 family PIN-like protein n=1 Tax=Larkinella sp. VNQ87 TaxID=3400921 RepID=UPI003BFFFB8A